MRHRFPSLILSVCLFALAHEGSARAALLWTYNYSGPGVVASGQLITNPLSAGFYLITDITGARNGDPITGLIPASSDASFSDNKLFPSVPFIDVFGFSFTTQSTGSFNVFHDQVPPPPPGCGSTVYAETPGNNYLCSNAVHLTSFDATFVRDLPEPATLALLGGGLLGLGLARRRKAA